MRNLSMVYGYVNNLNGKEDTLTRKIMKKYKTEFIEDAELTWLMQKSVSGLIEEPTCTESQ